MMASLAARLALACGARSLPLQSLRFLHQMARTTAAHADALRAVVEVVSDPDAISAANRDWMGQYTGASSTVARPRSVEQVAAVLRYCNEHRLGVVPQSGNTGLVGGSVPIADEVVLQMQRLDRIVSFDPVSGVLVCEAGCILEALDAALSAHGYTMPLDLGSKGSCQIGGNVATNAGGLRFLRYGSLHGSVLGLEAVLPDGTVLDCLSSLKKDNVGLDVKQLLIGSEGTLGVITKVAIQAVQRPASRQVCMLLAPSFTACAGVAAAARRDLGEILSAVEMVDGHAMSLTAGELHGFGASAGSSSSSSSSSSSGSLSPALAALPQEMLPVPMHQVLAAGTCAGGAFHEPDRFYVVIETAGSSEPHDREKLHAFLERAMSSTEAGEAVAVVAVPTNALPLPAPSAFPSLSAPALPLGSPLVSTGVVAADASQAAALWRLREEVSLALTRRGHVHKYDLSFPMPAMYDAVRATRAHLLAQGLGGGPEPGGGGGLVAVGYGHLFDGNIHLNVSSPWHLGSPASREAGASAAAARLHNALEPWVFDWTIARAGSVSAEHGLGQAKAHLLRRARPPAVLEVMRGLKALLDPRGIMNPRKAASALLLPPS